MTVCRLVNETPDDSIPVSDLMQGQVAEIVRCQNMSFVGLLVKRTATESLESLGGTLYWTHCAEYGGGFRVRVLPNGTLIRIEENE